METHVKVVAWLYIILGIVGLIVAACILAVLIGIGLGSGDHDANTVLTITALLLGGFLATVSTPGIIVGIGLLARRAWARILGLILAVFNLPNIPLGTIISIYALYVLLDDETSALF